MIKKHKEKTTDTGSSLLFRSQNRWTPRMRPISPTLLAMDFHRQVKDQSNKLPLPFYQALHYVLLVYFI